MTRFKTQLPSMTGLLFLLLTAACAESAGSERGDTGSPELRQDGGSAGRDGEADTDGDAAASGGKLDGALTHEGGTATHDGAAEPADASMATSPVGPAPVALGAAGNYAVLAKSAVSNVPTSAVTGDLGLSPAAATYITGLSLTRAGTKWTSPQVTGSIFAADNDPPTPTNLTTAIGSMETAYTDAAGRPTPTFLNAGAGTLGGMTLAPGLYKWSSSVTIPTDLAIAGAANDTWIFQIDGDLAMSANKRVTLSGGAKASNIVWQVAGSVELQTGAHLEGVVLSKTAITLGTGASINGRLLAQTAVNLAGSTVVAPAP